MISVTKANGGLSYLSALDTYRRLIYATNKVGHIAILQLLVGRSQAVRWMLQNNVIKREALSLRINFILFKRGVVKIKK